METTQYVGILDPQTVNVLITDGATMSDSEWSCAFDVYL